MAIFGFRPFQSKHACEVYISDGGAYMTDDMKSNPMELGTIELNDVTMPLVLGFIDSDNDLYPCGRRKKFKKLDNAGFMWLQWQRCKSNQEFFF